VRIRGETRTIFSAICADEGGTQGALFMFIVNYNGNQVLQANNCMNDEWVKELNTAHDNVLHNRSLNPLPDELFSVEVTFSLYMN